MQQNKITSYMALNVLAFISVFNTPVPDFLCSQAVFFFFFSCFRPFLLCSVHVKSTAFVEQTFDVFHSCMFGLCTPECILCSFCTIFHPYSFLTCIYNRLFTYLSTFFFCMRAFIFMLGLSYSMEGSPDR